MRRQAAEFFQHFAACTGRGVDQIGVGIATVIITHAAVGTVVLAEGASAVVAEGDLREGGVGELGVTIAREVEDAAIAAVAVLGGADFLDGLHVVVVPTPEVGGHLFIIGWGFCRGAGRLGWSAGPDVEFLPIT